MVRTLDGKIVLLPSKTPNGDYVPGVIQIYQVRGLPNRRETQTEPRYSFLPEHLAPELLEEFTVGGLKEQLPVRVVVEDSPGVYNTVTKHGIRRR